MQTYEVVLDALGDRTRRGIVEQLRRSPSTVGALAERLPVSRPAVSQHLKVLHGAGLVTFDQQGTRNVYALAAPGFDALRRWMEDFWETVLDDFARHATDTATKERP